LDILEILNPKAFLIAALVFIPLERLTALHGEQKVLRKAWQNDLVYALVNRIVIKLALIAVFAVALGALGLVIPPAIREAVSGQPLWLQVIEVFIIADLGFYLAHRAFHAVPFLWRFHSVHHSIEEMDWLAAHRVHPLDQIATQTASLLPVFALGFSGPAILIFAFVYQWQSLLIHSNTRISFGPLKWVLASPQFHHWHHGNQPEAYNRNFAGQLPFLDLLFGTFYLPREGTPRKYGINERLPPYYHQQLLYPFTGCFRRSEQPAARGSVAEAQGR
jgi:sterol desaturase/sphingolipid hydroxylase (fatty acid hydroxylase superfamily)